MKYLAFALLDVTDWEDETLQSIIKKHDIFHIRTDQACKATPFIGAPDAIGELISNCWSCDPSEYYIRLVDEEGLEAMKYIGKIVTFSEKEQDLHVKKAFEVDYTLGDEGLCITIGHRYYHPFDFLKKIKNHDFGLHESANEIVSSIIGHTCVFGTAGTIEKGEGKYFNFIAYNGESKYKMTMHEVAFAVATHEIKGFDENEARKHLSYDLKKLFKNNEHIIGESERGEILALVDSFYHENKH